MFRFVNDLQPLVRTGPAFECAECLAPILFDHIYFIDGSDLMGSHPYCWLCGTSIKLHLGQITLEEQRDYPQFGPL